MPSIEINAGSTAMDYCFVCDKPTLHNGAFLRWEDNSLEDVCHCTVCKSVHRSVLDNGVPHTKHQAHVHETAKKYLNACVTEDERLMKEVSEEFRRPAQGGSFSRKGLLLYLEVMEEALVLYKNSPDQWPMDDYYVRQLQQQCEGVRTVVTTARGGRTRPSTTPTLREKGNIDDEVLKLIISGEHFKAIRLVKEHYQISLVEAKKFVDELR